jgi:hypothetical protein
VTAEEAVAQCLSHVDYTAQGKWFFTDLGAYQAVIREVDTWPPADIDLFTVLLQDALG